MNTPQESAAAHRTVPAWLATALVVLGGAGAAGQAAVNAALAGEVSSALTAAVVSNTVGGLVFIAALLLSARVRSGLTRAWRHRLPWWMYSGGVFGAVFVFAGAHAVPLVGVAAFTVAQVCGNSLGALATDAAGLGPGGRLRATAPRILAAVLAIAAVGLAQVGRGTDTTAWWLVPVVMLIGGSLALQGAFNGQVNEITRNPMSTGFVNFAFGTGLLYIVYAVAAVAGAVPGFSLPMQPWFYLGGVFGASLVIVSMIAVRVIGVLRMAIGILSGQLGGAVALDVVAGIRPSGWVLGAVSVTVAAVVLAGLTRAPGAMRRVRSS